MEKSDLFKLAILNELLGEELHKVELSKILDNDAICKLRNGMKATNSLTGFFDKIFGFKTAEVFGNFCEQINSVVDDAIKVVNNESP